MSSAASEGGSQVRYLDVADRIWPLTRRFMGAPHLRLQGVGWAHRPQRPRRSRHDAAARPRRGEERHQAHLAAALLQGRRGRRRSSPPKAASRRTRPGTTTCSPTRTPRSRSAASTAPVHAREATKEERERLWPVARQAVPRLRRLPGAQQGPRNPPRHPRAALAHRDPIKFAMHRMNNLMGLLRPALLGDRGRRTRRRSPRAARGRPSCRGRRRS